MKNNLYNQIGENERQKLDCPEEKSISLLLQRELIERVGDCGYRFQVELIYTQKLIVDQQSVKHQTQPSTTKISIEIDNAVKAVDVMEDLFKKYHLDQLLKLDVFWNSILQFIADFGETSKDVFLDYVGRV